VSIRARILLWLGSFLLVALVVLTGLLYGELVELKEGVLEGGTTPEPAWQETGEMALFYGVPTVVTLLVGCWWLLRKLLAPITSLTQAAERIHATSLKERLPPTGRGDELDRLTEVFNSMTTRLDESFTLMRDFTLNASHELKTPLTILRGQIETRLRAADTSTAEFDFLGEQLDEIGRLTRIVDSLTLLSKADTGHLMIAREPVQLDELVRACFAEAQLLAHPHGLQVELTDCHAATVRGDRHRLKQLLLNLADNATKYAQPGGRVTIALNREREMAEVIITNTGPGITPEQLPRVFERFYRGDVSHNNGIEGSGLGLCIAQWITKAHGGTIELTSEPGILTTAKVKLPIGADSP
jgi:signal transduction histidine kinase